MGKLIQIVAGAVFLVALLYLALLGLEAFFDWVNPGGGSGRMARLTTGAIIGLGVTIAIIAFRRFRGR